MWWNHQKLLIFCCFIASVCVQSARGELTEDQMTKVNEFISSLQVAANNLNGPPAGNQLRLPKGYIKYFIDADWQHQLRRTSNSFIWDCTRMYETQCDTWRLTHGTDPDPIESARFAYEALDTWAKTRVHNFKPLLNHNEQLQKELHKILKRGKFLRFLAFYEAHIPTDPTLQAMHQAHPEVLLVQKLIDFLVANPPAA